MKVYCILSDERAYRSKSPAMFTTVMQRQGIRGMYVPFKVQPEEVGKALQSLKTLGIAGANVTIPYKQAVIPYLDILSEGANVIGAINTIVITGEELKGYNTNAIGFMDALDSVDFNPEGKSALIFGTGGAARAVAFILNWLRTDTIVVTGRSDDKVQQVVKRFGGEGASFESLGKDINADIVVNATSVSSPDESPEMAALVADLNIKGCELVVDLNYNRPQNFWQDMARDKDIRFMDGLLPLAYQARRTFALWTGQQLPPEEFINAINGNGSNNS
ncbi:MAG: Shikimate 5-dehydrogenase I alpha (EC 1.1.1.25) [Olavius algarvensis Delta 4 endosymbiont]|nr:MAG: Shikimate 5-dehydrogenase I alpha (EC 1.1.1.25) [Olavius algarvensis Delta 4 endosymbiont]